MVHGLAAQLGGALRLASRPGGGTSVELLLPAASSEAEGPVQPAPVPGGQRSGTALLVDDDELVRASTAEMLREIGFRVVEAECAEEGLRLARADPTLDAVVTDHLMPGMTGAELARILRRERPDLPVLVISGYANMDGIAPEIARLTKPFRQSDLARSLAALTGADAQGPS
jgi:CheY-like chemotaxis protein